MQKFTHGLLESEAKSSALGTSDHSSEYLTYDSFVKTYSGNSNVRDHGALYNEYLRNSDFSSKDLHELRTIQFNVWIREGDAMHRVGETPKIGIEDITNNGYKYRGLSFKREGSFMVAKSGKTLYYLQ